jgi:membrane protein DedA with SNARE-associated domain
MTPIYNLFNLMGILRHYENCMYIIIFLVVLLEGAAFVGILIPGELVVISAGYLAFQGYLEPEICFWIIAIGATLGDFTGYRMGKAAGRDYFANHKRLLFLRKKHIEKAEALLKEQGGMAIFLSRFVVGLRAITPFTAGMSRMSYSQFLVNNVAGAIVWTAVYVVLGYLLALSLQLIEMWSRTVGVFVFSIIIIPAGFIYIYWTAVKRPADAFIGSKCAVAVPSAFVGVFHQRYPRTAAFVRKRLATESFLGLNLTIRLVLGIILLWIFGEITVDILISNVLVTLDQRVFENILYFQTPGGTVLMATFSQMGGEIIQTIASIAVIIYLLYKKIFDYMTAYILAMVGGSTMVLGLKACIHRLRPEIPISETSLITASGWSFPSGHSMMSLIFYGMITYLIIRNICSRRFRVMIATVGVFTIFMIGVSRIYLRVHFLSDVVAGYTAGLFWLTVCITALEIYREKICKTNEKGTSQISSGD